MKKIIMSLSAICFSMTAFAATGSSNIKVSAAPIAGCLVSGTSFNFGNINSKVTPDVNATLTVQCSKGTQVAITGSDKNNPSLVNGPRMWLQGATSDKPETRVRYAVFTDKIVNTSDLQVIQYPQSHYLWNYGGASYDFRLIIKSLTGNSAVMTMKSSITESDAGVPFDNTVVLPGSYSDDYIYTLTY